MAFSINLYAGTATDSTDMFTKIIGAFTNVFGYLNDTGDATGTGWEVVPMNDTNTKYLLKSKGTQGLDDMVYVIELSGNITISGYQHYAAGELSTYGIIGQTFGTKTIEIRISTQQFWIYGNEDFIHIIAKGYGVATQAIDITPNIISFGKFIPTYNPSVTHVRGITQINQGADVLIPVEDASIFEPDRYIIISSAYTFEKCLVTEVAYAGNTIKVANISQNHVYVDGSPIILGEIAKPYYTFRQANLQGGATQEDSVMVFPRLSGSTLTITPTTVQTYGGSGVKCKIFKEIETLALNSALDMLNYDRYMFELYIYSTEEEERGFLGKLPYVYSVGSSDTNSESTIINDQYFLYRVFKCYGMRQSFAIRESYK